MVVHHIDGDRENNRLRNLIPVCKSCHSKIHSSGPFGELIDSFAEKLPDRSINYGANAEVDRDADKRLRISSENRDRLRSEKKGGESYDDVLDRLLPEE